MKLKLQITALIVIVAFSIATAPAFSDEARILRKQEYFLLLHEALKNAKDSIYVAMYIINIPKECDEINPACILVQDLIDAKNRGVKVKVVLDDSRLNVNYNAYRKLKEAGVDVSFDTPGQLLHGKGVVIDSNVSFIGSTNWTRASIEDNFEISSMINSPNTAETIVNHISGIPLSLDIPIYPEEEPGVQIPTFLLTDPDKLALLFTNHAEKAFDLYLYLAKQARQTNKTTLKTDFKDYARYLGYTENFYTNVKGPFDQLVNKYAFIRHDPWSKYLVIPIGPLEKPAALKAIPKLTEDADNAQSEFISIPYTYWQYDLDKNLSPSAKYMYLVSLLEAQKSSRAPYWFRSNKDLSEIYNISERSVNQGLGELEERNILEIYRYKPEKFGEFQNRPSNVYRMNPLVSEEEFKKAIKELEDVYGQELVQKARNLSSQLNDPWDTYKIRTYIGLIKEYGYDKVNKVNTEVAAKQRETGFRNLDQTILLLKQKE